MKKEKTIISLDFWVVILILILVFVLGFTISEKKEKDPTIFTRKDLERIAQLQEIEDSNKSEAEICAYKDKNGNLMITYDYNDTKWK